MGISQATFYAWRKKFGGLGLAELRRLRQEENRKLKQLVANEPGQGDVAGRAVKKVLRPTQRKTFVGHLIDRYRVGVRRACAVVKQSRSAFYYQPQDNDDALLLQRMWERCQVDFFGSGVRSG
ncbi:UNVERIFIED_ORG: hypothetical protein GGR78_003437 [Xanthomonas campestris]